MPLSFPIDVQREFFRNMENVALIQSDFAENFNIAEGVAGAIAGFGAGIFAPPIGVSEGHPGIWNLVTGTAPAGRVFVISRVNAFTVGAGSGNTFFESWIQLPTLSDAVNRYTARTGFFSIFLPNAIAQGIGFEYDDSQNGGRWQALTSDGVETSTDTGVLVVAGDWYKHSFIIPSNGNEIQFFIDDVLVATNTTNLPTGAGFSHFTNIHIMKLLGVASRAYFLDAYAVLQETGGRE